MWQSGLPDQRDKIKVRGSNPSMDAGIATPVQPGSEWPGPRSAPRSHGVGGSTRLLLPHTLLGHEATGPARAPVRGRALLCSHGTRRTSSFFTVPQADILHQHFFDPRTWISPLLSQPPGLSFSLVYWKGLLADLHSSHKPQKSEEFCVFPIVSSKEQGQHVIFFQCFRDNVTSFARLLTSRIFRSP